MKKLEVVIPSFLLDEVTQAVTDLGIERMTVSDVRGYGPRDGPREIYRGQEYVVVMQQVKIELVVPDELSENIVMAVTGAVLVYETGDGYILISDVADVARIRTGHRGESVLYQ